MSDLWRWFLGIEDLVVPEGGQARLEMASLPESVWALATILLIGGACVAAFWIYRREGEAPAWKRMSLATLRSLVVILIAFVLLEPNLVFDVERTVDSTTILLVDDSLSMAIRDRYEAGSAEAVGRLVGPEETGDGVSRAVVAEAILTDPDLRWIERLRERNRLQVYTFSDGIAPLDPDAPVFPPRGQATNLSRGVRRALEDNPGQTIAGVIILSDGRLNGGEPASVVARTLAARGTPAHVVGIGDPRPPRNIRVDSILAPERVFAKDPVLFEIRIASQGLAGETVTGELLQAEDGVEGSTVVEEIPVELAGGEQSVTLRVRPERPGRFLYTFRIAPRPGEVIPEDNQKATPVTVVDDVIHVLLISGGPSFEYRYLKNLLLRDPTVELAAWLQSADLDFLQEGNVRIDRLPLKEEEFRKYDVVILLDPDPVEIDAAWVESLGSFVSDHGGGLFFSAGPKFTLALLKSPGAAGILSLLPVEIDIGTVERSFRIGRSWSDSWPHRVTPEGLDHPVGMLGKSRQESEAIWKALPGFRWHFPVEAGSKGAMVLVRHSDPRERGSDDLRPILATHRGGAGRVIFSATDEFWRWRGVAEEIYNRFWMQNIRHLVGGRLLGGKRRVTVLLDKETYALGEPMEVSVRLLDRNYVPIEVEEVRGTIRARGQGAQEFTLSPLPGNKGEYRGVAIPGAAGTYEIRIGEDLGEAGVATVNVDLPNLEFEDPRMDEGLLREVADSTGGRYYTLAEIGALPDDIPDRRETVLVNSSPVSLWDAPAVLAALAGLLTLEWFFRKRNQMA